MDTINFLTSIAVAVIASVLTVYLTFRKYKSEKWWDKKAECYIDTIEALNNMVQYCDAVLQGGQGWDEELDDSVQSLQEKFNQGKLEFEKQTNIGRLLLSNEAQGNLLTLDHAICAAGSENSQQRKMSNIRVAVEECLYDFIPNAQNDLKVTSPFSWKGL